MTPKSSGVSPEFQSLTQSLPTCLMAQRGSLLETPNRMAPLFPSSGQRDSREGLGDLHSPSGFWQGPNAVSAPAPQVAMPCI